MGWPPDGTSWRLRWCGGGVVTAAVTLSGAGERGASVRRPTGGRGNGSLGQGTGLRFPSARAEACPQRGPPLRPSGKGGAATVRMPGSPTQGGLLTSATYCHRRIPFSKGSAPLVSSAPYGKHPRGFPGRRCRPHRTRLSFKQPHRGCLNALRFVGLPAVESSSPQVYSYHQFRCDGPSRGPLPPVRYRPEQIPLKKKNDE